MANPRYSNWLQQKRQDSRDAPTSKIGARAPVITGVLRPSLTQPSQLVPKPSELPVHLPRSHPTPCFKAPRPRAPGGAPRCRDSSSGGRRAPLRPRPPTLCARSGGRLAAAEAVVRRAGPSPAASDRTAAPASPSSGPVRRPSAPPHDIRAAAKRDFRCAPVPVGWSGSFWRLLGRRATQRLASDGWSR